MRAKTNEPSARALAVLWEILRSPALSPWLCCNLRMPAGKQRQ